MAKKTEQVESDKEKKTTARKLLEHFNAMEGSGISLAPSEEFQLAAEVDAVVESETLKRGKDEDLSTFEFASGTFGSVIGKIHIDGLKGNKLKNKIAEGFVKKRVAHWQAYIRGVQRLKTLQERMYFMARDQV